MTKRQGRTATNSEVSYCQNIVDKIFKPIIEKNLAIVNKFLAKKELRAGIEITWFFDSTDKEGELDASKDFGDNQGGEKSRFNPAEDK